ncbi:MAG: hypothetical protein BGO55_08860 [Sphingobacteriales bacterium 50-39]|nr:hypothetical protein [Sphingobacteriales bacterium]OJW59372.1 MAG: hypothetical protein BGO55_08860 [Sphingobacteriales bacterium 50-39]
MQSTKNASKPEQYLEIPMKDMEEILANMENALSNQYEWIGWRQSYHHDHTFYYLPDQEAAQDFCWDTSPLLYASAIKLEPFYHKIKDALDPLDFEPPLTGNIKVPTAGIEVADPAKSRFRKDFLAIGIALEYMGMLYNDILPQLKDQIRGKKDPILLNQRIYYGGHEITGKFEFARNQEGEFNLHSIHLKGILIDDVTIAGINTGELDKEARELTGKDWTDDISAPLDERYDKRLFDGLDAKLSMLESTEEGKIIAGKIRAKYDYGEPFPGTAVEQSQHFIARPGFTLDHALNLFLGRDVMLNIPGQPEGIRAWFKLDPVLKDDKGNAYLLQYGPQHNFNIQEAIENLPRAYNKHFIQVPSKLEEGYGQPADLIIGGVKHTVNVVANPANGNLKIYEGIEAKRELLVMPETIAAADKGFVYAYDTDLRPLKYPSEHLAEDNKRSTVKAKIREWLEGDPPEHEQQQERNTSARIK